MKHISKILIVLFISMFVFSVSVEAQTSSENTPKIYLVQKQNGVKFIGEILSSDAREILIHTLDLGDIYIPKHEIKEIREILPESNKQYITEELFATRYFITTNGLPIKKGENYIQWNLYGPDFQFGVADNFGVGIMTSWAAIPIIANAKYTIKLGEKSNLALGALAGTGTWAYPKYGLMLPYVAYTYGTRRNNINFSLGYAEIFYEEENWDIETNAENNINRQMGRVLFSVAGMAKLNEKFSLVFDSFISPWGPDVTSMNQEPTEHYDPVTQSYYYTYKNVEVTEKSKPLALLLPGIRWQIDADRAFQFGFTGFYYDTEFIPFPIPMVQWYRRL